MTIDAPEPNVRRFVRLNSTATLYFGDNKEVLKGIRGVHACVTDPPYGLSFMGKAWDYDVPPAEAWAMVREALRPGSHLLSFFGTRTYHRGVTRIEDAGFDIRDQIAWIYGSGFPKSLDVSKAIDKAAGAERERGAARGKIGTNKTRVEQGYRPNEVAQSYDSGPPITDAAREWEGWGTALKPAMEPIVVARIPLIGTVVENVLEHGTGGINIDQCRVSANGDKLDGGRISSTTDGWDRPWKHDDDAVAAARDRGGENVAKAESLGRWPANVIHDGSDEVVGLFPVTTSRSGGISSRGDNSTWSPSKGMNTPGREVPRTGHDDTGSAARFFYCAKSSQSERGDENTHPTVKPIDLMEYLVKLVTREGQTVLDPYMGSGTTGIACLRAGRNFIGIERDPEHYATAVERFLVELDGVLL